MNWTKAQQAAIETDNRNLLVSAAAGSGKTAVLAARIVRLVQCGAGIDRFLIVTFTEAATAEMKRRIASRLYEAAAAESDPAAATRLRAEALAASRANISTLHAFCLYILRRNFHLLGLDPAFRTADGPLSAMLRAAALEEAAADCYEREDAGFLALLRGFGGKEEVLFDAVQRLYDFLMAQIAPWDYLEHALEIYGGDEAALAAHPAMGALLSHCKAQAAAQAAALTQARALVPPGKESVQALLDDDLSQVRALQLASDITSFRERLFALSFRRFSWPGKDMQAEKEIVKSRRDSAKRALQGMQALFPRTMAEEAASMRAMRPQMQALATLLRNFHDRYTARKEERGLVDFADMEHLALRALEYTSVREGLRQRFQYIFVDEYQDSSHIQEALIGKICREDNLFLVGDVKQSIYRFRQADPGLFLSRLARCRAGADGTGLAIHLNINFRSSAPVVDAVNAVFSRVMQLPEGEITYDDEAALRRLPDAPPGEALDGCELHIIAKRMEAPVEDATEGLDDLDDAQAEALLAARRIRELMRTTQYRDPQSGRLRKLRYGDFAVLLRAHRPLAQAWAQALSMEGIPAYVQLTGGYFDAIEVQVFLSLLRVIDNARQDIPLLSLLRSPIFGFSLEELVELRTAYEGETLYERLEAAASGGALAARANEVFAHLAAWRAERLLLPLHAYLAQLLDETGYYDIIGALPAGAERQANLDALLSRAAEYEGLGVANDLSGFLAYMEGAENTAQMGAAQAGAADVVRVLSMHASKGLEYPVVLLAGLGRKFAFLTKAGQEPLVYARELGLGARLIQDGTRRDTMLRQALLQVQAGQQLAEEMRILYVGMTRARGRLVLLGCMQDARERAEKLLAGAAGAERFLDWLLPILLLSPELLPYVLHPRESIAARQDAQPEEAQPPADTPPAFDPARLRTHLAWEYPHQQATAIPTKRSVSEMVQHSARRLEAAPAFIGKGGGLTGAQRGEAVHTVLRELRLESCAAGQERPFLEAELARMAAARILSPAQASSIDTDALFWFLRSAWGLRLRGAARVERELEFAMELPAKALLDTDSAETMLLQGVIDCCFLENSAWTLLDFKTDRRKPGMNAAEAAGQHTAQLRLYAAALEKLSGLAVSQMGVVLLSYREVVPV